MGCIAASYRKCSPCGVKDRGRPGKGMRHGHSNVRDIHATSTHVKNIAFGWCGYCNMQVCHAIPAQRSRGRRRGFKRPDAAVCVVGRAVLLHLSIEVWWATAGLLSLACKVYPTSSRCFAETRRHSMPSVELCIACASRCCVAQRSYCFDRETFAQQKGSTPRRVRRRAPKSNICSQAQAVVDKRPLLSRCRASFAQLNRQSRARYWWQTGGETLHTPALPGKHTNNRDADLKQQQTHRNAINTVI